MKYRVLITANDTALYVEMIESRAIFFSETTENAGIFDTEEMAHAHFLRAIFQGYASPFVGGFYQMIKDDCDGADRWVRNALLVDDMIIQKVEFIPI